MRVVLFKVNHLGDNVVFLPVVQTLRRLRPDWRITVLTAQPEQILYRGHLPAEQIWTPPNRLAFHHSWRNPFVLGQWWFRLRREQPDVCLLSYDQCNAAHLLAKWSGARVRIGARLPFLKVAGSMTHEVPRAASRKIVDWNWAMGRTLIEATGGHDWPENPPPPDLAALAGPARGRERLVVIHAGARNDIRRWPAERMALVGARLAAAGWKVIWVDRPDTRLATLPAGVTPLPCEDLATLTGLLARAALLLCNNSGPSHIANAVGTPLVVISGPTSFDWDPYWNPEHNRVLRMPGLACIACEDSGTGTDFCANRTDPLICLRHWTAEAVEQACLEMLEQTKGRLSP